MEQRELSWRERGRLWLRIGIRAALLFSLIVLAVILIPPLWNLLAPFILAFLMAWMLNPLIRTIQKRIPISRRILSMLLVVLIFALLTGMIFFFIWSVISEIQSLTDNWQSVLDSLTSYVSYLQNSMTFWYHLLPDEVVSTVNDLIYGTLDRVKEVVPSMINSVMLSLKNVFSAVPSFAVATVVFIMGTYFITADYPRLRFLMTDHLSPELDTFLTRVKATATGAFGGYVRAEFILSVGVFLILLIGFLITRQSYGILLAALLAVLDFIPIIGAGTVMVPWAVICVFIGDFRSAVELMVIWGVIILFRRLSEPKVVGDHTGLSPILSLVAIYAGMRVAGVLGMVLAPVVALVVINVVRMGTFTPFVSDLKLAANDCLLLLRKPPRKDPPGDAS
ncbi:MAG: Sporulation integral rane protein YtvI [Oscillospiraceae bacterium]|nr:Sporulation integral rane protein YtvI [Oscillospiraceae bacterium]